MPAIISDQFRIMNAETFTKSLVGVGSTANTYYTFSVTAIVPYNSGVVKLNMPKNTTSQLPIGRYVWDLLITIGGITTKAAEGTVIVKGTAS
jgi:hypothetical protein